MLQAQLQTHQHLASLDHCPQSVLHIDTLVREHHNVDLTVRAHLVSQNVPVLVQM